MYKASLLLALAFLAGATAAAPSTPVAPTTACSSTADPAFCNSVLPPGAPQNLYTYGRFSVAKSLAGARKFLDSVNRYLSQHSSLSPAAVAALADCQLLSSLNIDFLNAAGAALNSTAGALLDPQAETVQTLLSALLTNQQTCSDGIQAASAAWSLRQGLAAPLTNSTKLYALSLSLFTKAWQPPKKPHNSPAFHRPRIPKSPGGRRLLQVAADAAVLVNAAVTVSQSGDGNYSTIGEAVAAAPSNLNSSTGYFVIYVAAGVYEEYVVVPKAKKYLMMVGAGVNQTVITGNRSFADGWTTFNSATFAVVGQGFVGVNMTIRNTAGAAKHQAVALRNGADLSAFYGCSLEGYQDTLYAHSLRQFYRDCDISGTVDYIFGNAAVVFQSCRIHSLLPLPGQQNTITAQGRTDPNQNTGTSIQGCQILAAPDLAAAGGAAAATFLGRPWKNYSRTVVMESFIDAAVDPAGWLQWDSSSNLAALYYAEYANTGAGAATAGRVAWPGFHVITGGDAGNFTVTNLVLGDNWLPQTGVPFLSGLST